MIDLSAYKYVLSRFFLSFFLMKSARAVKIPHTNFNHRYDAHESILPEGGHRVKDKTLGRQTYHEVVQPGQSRTK